MTRLAQRICKISSVFSIFTALVAPASAQDLGSAMLFGLGKSVISEGEELLNDAPDKLNAFLKSAEQGQAFPSGTECLGALQVAVNAGSIIANILPFSSVETFEDKRGPVAKFRVLLNGEKVHLEAFCYEEKMSAVPLSWGEGNPTPEKITQSSLDAVAGLLLLLQAQGAFEKEAFQTSATQQPQISQSWSSAAPVAGFPSFGENDILSDGFKIVNFTASWCSTCSSDYALLAAVNDDVPVYGVFFRESAPNTNEVFSNGIQPYEAIVSDVTGEISLDYELAGVPETLLVGDQGVVLVRHVGPLTPDALREKFMPLLTGQYSPEPQRYSTSDAVSDALQTALKGANGLNPSPGGQNGSPMAKGEYNALRVAVQQCWNVGSLSSEALRTTVVVAFSMTEDGRPLPQTLRMLSYEGGSSASARQAFESARRAIIRCGANGFELPANWIPNNMEVSLTFDPEDMRIR